MNVRFGAFSLQQFAGVFILLALTAVRADDFAVLLQDRTSIERVYYAHRLGQKPPFELISPPPLIERLVGQDLGKEAVLKKVYGVEITSAMLAAEVQRINTTTRAPEILAEIKTALGDDPGKFANTFAKPFLVERLLRDKFENDDALHAPQRRTCEQMRTELLKGKTNGDSMAELLARLKRAHSNAVTETTWQLTPRLPETNAPSADEIEIKKRFGPDAQLLASPQGTGKQKFYFEDLPAPLQQVLRIQLRQPGDVSAVIEPPGGFLLYVCKEKSPETLAVATLSLPKRSYEEWLAEQEKGLK